jgi:hypothetical protein
MRSFLFIVLFLPLVLIGQTRTPAKKTTKSGGKAPAKDTLVATQTEPSDTLDPRDTLIRSRKQFAVYSKRGRGKDKRLKLCMQLTGPNVLNYCINDSTTRDPEMVKELWRTTEGDSTFVLLYVDAFTKGPIDKLCDSGHETKIMFFRWNHQTNKAILKQKTIASCIKAITNMTKGFDPKTYDGSSPLVFEYNKGVSFLEVKFEPSNYKAGLQTGAASTDSE